MHNQFKHTPGPWHKVRVFVDNNKDEIQIHSAASRFGSSDCVAVLGEWLVGPGMQNANLICAAPELLEAARNLIAITNTQEFSKILDDANFLDDDSFYNLLLACDKAEGKL